jgi:hypothetical protein
MDAQLAAFQEGLSSVRKQVSKYSRRTPHVAGHKGLLFRKDWLIDVWT